MNDISDIKWHISPNVLADIERASRQYPLSKEWLRIMKLNDRREYFIIFLQAFNEYRSNNLIDENSQIAQISKGNFFESYVIDNIIYCRISKKSIYKIIGLNDFKKYIHILLDHDLAVSKKTIKNRKLRSAIIFNNNDEKLNALYRSFLAYMKEYTPKKIRALYEVPYSFLVTLFTEKYNLPSNYLTETFINNIVNIEGNLYINSSDGLILPTYENLCTFIYTNNNLSRMINLEDSRTILLSIRKMLSPIASPTKQSKTDPIGIYYYDYANSYINPNLFIYYDQTNHSFKAEHFIRQRIHSDIMFFPPMIGFGEKYVPEQYAAILQAISGGDTGIIDTLTGIVASAFCRTLKSNYFILFNGFPWRRRMLIYHLLKTIIPDNKATYLPLGKLCSSNMVGYLALAHMYGIRLNISYGKNLPTDKINTLNRILSNNKTVKGSLDTIDFQFQYPYNLIYLTEELNLKDTMFKGLNLKIIEPAQRDDISNSEFISLIADMPNKQQEISWMQSRFALHGLKKFFEPTEALKIKPSDETYVELVKKFVETCCIFNEHGVVLKKNFNQSAKFFWDMHYAHYGSYNPTIFNIAFKQLYSVKSSKKSPSSKHFEIEDTIINKLRPTITVHEKNKYKNADGSRTGDWNYTGISLDYTASNNNSNNIGASICTTRDYLLSMNSLLPDTYFHMDSEYNLSTKIIRE